MGDGQLQVARVARHRAHRSADRLEQRGVVGGFGSRPGAPGGGRTPGTPAESARRRDHLDRRWQPPDCRPPASRCRSPGAREWHPSAPDGPVTAATTLSNKAGEANGRAASWTTTTVASAGTAASPARTEAAREAPPSARTSAPKVGSGASAPAGCPAGTTRTTPVATPRAAATERSATVRPPSSRNCFGRPNRSPEPPATTMAQTTSDPAAAGSGRSADVVFTKRSFRPFGSGQRLVQPQLGGLLVDLEGERQLGHQDLPGPAQHALLPGGQPLVLVPDRQVPDHFGHLVDVA